MKRKAKYILRRLDFFGIPITFTGAHRQTYQTKLGGIISIFFVIYMAYISSKQIQKIALQEKLEIQSQEILYDIPPPIQISNQNLMFAVQTIPFAQPYYYFTLHHKQFSKDFLVNITLEKCQNDHFSKLYYYNNRMKEKLKNYNLSQFLCPSFQNTFNITGQYDSENFELIELALHTNPEISRSEIDQFVISNNEKLKIKFILANVNINQESINAESGLIDSDLFVELNPVYQNVQVNYFLRRFEMMTDFNLYFGQSLVEENFLYHKQEEIEFNNVYSLNSPKVFSFFLRSSEISLVVSRQFYKISDFLSYIGGLAKSVYMLIGFLIFIYNRYQLWLKLFKINYQIIMHQHQLASLARLKLSKRGHHLAKPRKKKKQIPEMKKYSENTKILIQGLVKDKYNKVNTIIPQLKYQLTALFWWVKEWTVKRACLIESINIVQKDLNIVSYFRLIRDVQRLKRMFLNQQQLRIFNLHPKETLVIKVQDFKNSQQNIRSYNSLKIQILGLEKVGFEDLSYQLDSHNIDLYGSEYENKLIVDFLVLIENLHQLEVQKERNDKDKDKDQTQNGFEQLMSTKLVQTLQDDIKEILTSDEKFQKIYDDHVSSRIEMNTNRAQEFLDQNLNFTSMLKLRQVSNDNKQISPKSNSDRKRYSNINLNTINESIQESLSRKEIEYDVENDFVKENEVSLQQIENYSSEVIYEQTMLEQKVSFSRDLTRQFLISKNKLDRFDKAQLMSLMNSYLQIEQTTINLLDDRLIFRIMSPKIDQNSISYTISVKKIQTINPFQFIICFKLDYLISINGQLKSHLVKSYEHIDDFLIIKLGEKQEDFQYQLSYDKQQLIINYEQGIETNNYLQDLKNKSAKLLLKSDDGKVGKILLNLCVLKNFKVKKLQFEEFLFNSQRKFRNHLYFTVDEISNKFLLEKILKETKLMIDKNEIIGFISSTVDDKLYSRLISLNEMYNDKKVLNTQLFMINISNVSEIIVEIQYFQDKVCVHFLITKFDHNLLFFQLFKKKVQNLLYLILFQIEDPQSVVVLDLIYLLSAFFIETINNNNNN